MKVVLFGAGASYGCGGILPTRPPLGFGLFLALRRLYATWRGIPEGTSGLFAADFEQGMADVIQKYGFAIAPLMQDMAIFFSCFHLSNKGESLYDELVRHIEQCDDMILSTLNYECVLEHAVARAGHQIDYFVDPKSADHVGVPIWKLHGSCNFKVTNLEATRGVTFGTGVTFGGGIEPIEPYAVRAVYRGNTALYPAMALFAHGKPISMSPEPLQTAQKRWAEHVKGAETVVVLGVHPNPEDDHIWRPLAETGGEVCYVGAERAFENWVAKHRGGRPERFLGETWNVCRQEVLAAITA